MPWVAQRQCGGISSHVTHVTRCGWAVTSSETAMWVRRSSGSFVVPCFHRMSNYLHRTPREGVRSPSGSDFARTKSYWYFEPDLNLGARTLAARLKVRLDSGL
jgi:hypothetical protein